MKITHRLFITIIIVNTSMVISLNIMKEEKRLMPHPKKKERPMIYYLIENKITGWYFCNKSTHPEASVRRHFHRAQNPKRDDYDCQFYRDIRKYYEEGDWKISYSLEMPENVARRAHYLPPQEKEKEWTE